MLGQGVMHGESAVSGHPSPIHHEPVRFRKDGYVPGTRIALPICSPSGPKLFKPDEPHPQERALEGVRCPPCASASD
jgi:hypothetical protein